MKAAILYGPGSPAAFVIEDVPIPPVERGDVLVRVHACGVSSRDVVERKGVYRRDVTYPLIMGLEISGVVMDVGAGVTQVAPGNHVCSKAFSSCGHCRFCRNGRESSCRERRPVRGGYAEYVVLPEDALVVTPPEIAFEIACSLGPTAGVALNAIRDTARVQIGDEVLVTGASGGVGSYAVQLAKLAGARVLALTRTPDKGQALVDVGADEIVVSADGRFTSEVMRLTAGWGVDVVVDTVGSRVFESCFNSLAVHGRYAVVGQLDAEESPINLARLFFKRAQLLGVGSVSRTQLEDVIELVMAGRISGHVGMVLPLDQVAKAHELVETGQVLGRVVLKPDQ